MRATGALRTTGAMRTAKPIAPGTGKAHDALIWPGMAQQSSLVSLMTSRKRIENDLCSACRR
jgi:hypothetical protein